jgi:hypothetical protein
MIYIINRNLNKVIIILMALCVAGLLMATTIEVDKIVVNSKGEEVIVKSKKAKKTPQDTANPSPSIAPSAAVVKK